MALRFGSALKELRIHLCQKSEASKGVRDFITEHYVPLKTANPKFPILVRECSGIQPRIYARYEHGKESSVAVPNMTSADILKHLQSLVKGIK